MRLFKNKRIYTDWSATTPVHKKVLKAMKKAGAFWANPSAIYKEGGLAKSFQDDQKSIIAKVLSIKSDEIIMTSGGTESNNLIINSAVSVALKKGKGFKDLHIVTSNIEHSSILETLKELEKKGLSVTYVPVNKDGLLNEQEVIDAINENTILVTCMYVNNEIGTIEPISKIGSAIRKIKKDGFPIFHSDASQAPMYLSCDPEGLRVDALTLDAHKMQGPKGVGMLFLKRNTLFEPLMFGGGQEGGKRPTTESLVLLAGFASALKLASSLKNKRFKKASLLQDYFLKEVKSKLVKACINGSLEKRLPNNVNISLPNINDPEFAVLILDNEGIACSTKSSCLKGEEKSYVVSALTKDLQEDWRASKTLRFSFGPSINKSQIDRIIKALLKL